MLDAKNILFPTDFSDSSLKALHGSRPFLDRPDTKLHVLHLISWHGRGVFSGGEYGLPMPSQRRILNKLEEEAQQKLNETVGNTPHEFIQILDESKNSIAESVVEYIEGNDIDLVVVGSDGGHEIFRNLVGGTVEKILVDSPVPVLAVGPELTRLTRSKRSSSRLTRRRTRGRY